MVALALILGGCGLAQTRPKKEMSLAQAAYLAAKNTRADEYAPNLFRKAEFYYLKAKSAYKRKYFSKAKDYATLSRKYSERAEYTSHRKIALDVE